MSELRSALKDRVVGKSFELLSKAGKVVPRLGRLLMGDHPAEWTLTGTHADSIDWGGVINGVPDAIEYDDTGVTPNSTVVLLADKEVLAALAEKRGGTPALAYRIGSAVMVTHLPEAPKEAPAIGMLPMWAKENNVVMTDIDLGVEAALGVHLPNNRFIDVKTEKIEYEGVPLHVVYDQFEGNIPAVTRI